MFDWLHRIRGGQAASTQSAAAADAASSAGDVDSSRQVLSDTCVVCGYGIAGLSREGNCPECGTPILRSELGDRLSLAGPEYLATLRLGFLIVTVSILLDVLWWFLVPFTKFVLADRFGWVTQSAGDQIATILGAVFGFVSLTGWWLTTTPDPARSETSKDTKARRVLRVIVVGLFIATVAGLAIQLIPAAAGSAWGTFSGNIVITPGTVWSVELITAISLRAVVLLVTIAKFFVGLVYLKWIAGRIPDPKLAKQTGNLIWLIPLLLTFGWLLLGLGPIIAIILYWRILRRFGKAVRPEREAEPRPQAST